MSRKKVNKRISLLLVFCLVFTQIPAIAFAQTEGPRYVAPSKASAIMAESTNDSTTFDLGGGLKHTTFHGSSVRFENEEGELTDYNPKLVKVRDRESESGHALGAYGWKNKTGDSSQFFPETLNAESPLLMEKDNYSISMSLEENVAFQNWSAAKK